MEQIIQSVEKSLENENWYSALSLSLILPDICGNFEDSNKGSQRRYSEWFEKYLGNKYNGFLSGKDCYAFRCSFLHEGSDEITLQKAREVLDFFIFTVDGAHRCFINNSYIGDPKCNRKRILKLVVSTFCKDIIGATNEWLKKTSKDTSEILKIHEGPVRIGGILIK